MLDYIFIFLIFPLFFIVLHFFVKIFVYTWEEAIYEERYGRGLKQRVEERRRKKEEKKKKKEEKRRKNEV